jgi:hypothetical protein
LAKNTKLHDLALSDVKLRIHSILECLDNNKVLTILTIGLDKIYEPPKPT